MVIVNRKILVFSIHFIFIKMTEEGEWQTCVVDDDYEIFSEYPYPIKRKGSDKTIKESIHKHTGYIVCKLNNKQYRKHRIIALQFIDNDDENKTEIDHMDRNKTNNHIDNLRWTTRQENLKNRSGRNHKYIFIDELPETAESLDSYNGYDLNGVFVDYENKKVYLFNGVKWRELVPCRDRGNIYYRVYDIEQKQISLYHKVLFE